MKYMLGFCLFLLSIDALAMSNRDQLNNHDITLIEQTPILDKKSEISWFRATIGFAMRTKHQRSVVIDEVSSLCDDIIQRSYDGIDAVKEDNILGVEQAKLDIAFYSESIAEQTLSLGK